MNKPVNDLTPTERDAPVSVAESSDVEGAGADPDAEIELTGDTPRGSGLSWPQVMVLTLAVGFLGFALALFLNRDDNSPMALDSVDVGFLQDMDTHHDQAVAMAHDELLNGESLDVLKMAWSVAQNQSWEMGIMEQMLAERGRTPDGRPDEAMAWMGMPVPVAVMPGLMSAERMNELGDAEGAEADALFLGMMAEHHLGGLHMAEYAAEHAESEDVRVLARRIAHNQAKEINEYAIFSERLGFDLDIQRVDVPPAD